ncbi:hypothetical protein EVA_09935 [gut metagenome]|uniref:Uncharacterized protein n=1 Tax=gut metagenome TaxID=749906 RepID=J9GIY7_9ZZZZ
MPPENGRASVCIGVLQGFGKIFPCFFQKGDSEAALYITDN